MATRDVFSTEEPARLRGFPDINRAELIRYPTLTGVDEAFVRRFRAGRNVLGVAVQLYTLPWLGFVPDEVAAAAAVGRSSQRLGIAMGELRGYGGRERTRTDHLREVAAYAGRRSTDTGGWKDLDEFLFAFGWRRRIWCGGRRRGWRRRSSAIDLVQELVRTGALEEVERGRRETVVLSDRRRPASRKVLQRNPGGGVGSGRWCS